jgi:threonyl-tRNA synthetase
MKIITLHCDYIKFEATKKAIKEPEQGISNDVQTVKEPLVILTAIEKGDSPTELKLLVEAVKKTAQDVKAKSIVLYPYAHLSSNLAPPNQALEYLQIADKELSKTLKVTRAPFGYYKSFELKCKGHPLAELSKEFPPTSTSNEKIDLKDLLHKMEKVKMSTQKAPKGLKSNVELGRDLDLYIVSEIIGSGLPLFTPKGTTIKREIERFITDEEINRGYLHTSTPLMAKSDLYKVSGHWQHYQDSMFIMNIGSDKYALRPMTCPFQFVLYKRKPRSYKELPIKYAEVATLFRNEQSGELRGLTRVRQFNLADAHIICRPDQVDKEFSEAIDLIKYVMKTLNIEKDIWYRFSKYDSKDKSKYIQNTQAWDSSQKMMKKILDKLKIKYIEANGEAAFYGPKLDLQYKDVFGKEDTLLTIQIDFALPERYDMKYKDENNNEQRPMIIHRSSTGATERLIAFLLEKTQGHLPLWLSPVQVRVINFTDRNTKAAEKTISQLKQEVPQLRIDKDFRSTTVNEKIRDAEMQKIPYIIVIGDKEEKSKTLAVRQSNQKPKFKVSLNTLSKEIKEKIEKRL